MPTNKKPHDYIVQSVLSQLPKDKRDYNSHVQHASNKIDDRINKTHNSKVVKLVAHYTDALRDKGIES